MEMKIRIQRSIGSAAAKIDQKEERLHRSRERGESVAGQEAKKETKKAQVQVQKKKRNSISLTSAGYIQRAVRWQYQPVD